MVEWFNDIKKEIYSQTSDDPFWGIYLRSIFSTQPKYNLHLAIFIEPYLQLILDGKKTIESRFSTHQCSPFKCVNNGDVILLKRSGGPIVGISSVTNTWFYNLTPETFHFIMERFGEMLCVNDSLFWKNKKESSYASLIELSNVKSITPIDCKKKDRRGWVTLNSNPQQLTLNYEESCISI